MTGRAGNSHLDYYALPIGRHRGNVLFLLISRFSLISVGDGIPVVK